MKKYFVGTQSEVQIAINQVDANCGFPNKSAKTWAEPMPTAREGYSYAEAPTNGYNDITGEQMMKNVVTIPVDSVDLPVVDAN